MKQLNDIETAILIADLVNQYGGTAYYVGGYVRDKLLGNQNKDIDIEVHGIEPVELEGILDLIGTKIEIGTSFGVYGLKGYNLDIAMPRKETAIGRGHKDFSVSVDPYIGTEKAAIRRDFTINSLMQNILTGEIIDHFHGQDDIKNKIIRHIDNNSFIEDPLRVLRAAQFSSRFNFTIANSTKNLCRGIDLSFLPSERVFAELEKALLKSDHPSICFKSLREIDQLSVWLPELQDLIFVPQNPVYHAEGDVWNHTMLVVDQSAKRRSYANYPLGLMVSALVHDFGKAICTDVIDGKIRSFNHEKKGLPLIKQFLLRLTSEKKLFNYVMNMSELHMMPNTLACDNSSIKATNKMFDRSIDPNDLILLSSSDDKGRIKRNSFSSDNEIFLNERLSIFNKIMSQPFVMGKDLIEAGLKPDKNFSSFLSYAHKLRLAGIKKESALKQTLAYAHKALK